MFKNLSLQERFYVGYVYLIVLGIVSDALFYAVLRVPYLNYVTILDALISPINLITNDWKMPLALIVAFTFMYFYFTKFMPRFHDKLRDKKWYKKTTNIEKWDKLFEKQKESNNLIPSFMGWFFLLFISMSLGRGMGTKKKINDNNYKTNWKLIFKDNSSLDVYKIGQNSSYMFYLEKGEKEITVTPILENIKQIKRIQENE